MTKYESSNPDIAHLVTQIVASQIPASQIQDIVQQIARSAPTSTNTDAAKGASTVLNSRYYVAVATLQNNNAADDLINKKISIIQTIDPNSTLEKCRDSRTGWIGIAISPSLSITKAQDILQKVREKGIPDAYIVPSVKATSCK